MRSPALLYSFWSVLRRFFEITQDTLIKDAMHSDTSYRPDIDGLRAVAILSVVGFHAFPGFFRGGFVGVDIFFVISGYLISSIIYKLTNVRKFSFSDFYIRRVKRIYPALVVVISISLLVGWFVLLSDEYAQLGKHTAAGALFVSNIIFWREAGYFDNAAESKPLLHLWSLGVEEQFYILWPFFVWMFAKTKQKLVIVAISVAVISFAFNLYYVRLEPSATFYSPLTRFWELLSGSVLAWFHLNKGTVLDLSPGTKSISPSAPIQVFDGLALRMLAANVVSAVGIVFLISAFTLIDKDVKFPGGWALLPVLGAALIIAAGPAAVFNRLIFANRCLVWVGLISYPLYLWHWPLLAFTRIIWGTSPPSVVRILLVFVAIGFAWVTYRFVELPIRLKPTRAKEILFLFATMFLLGVIGFVIYRFDGVPSRKVSSENRENSVMLTWKSEESAGCAKKLGVQTRFCLELGDVSKQTVAVIGDSTANAITPGLYRVIYKRRSEGLINVGAPTCPPIRGLAANNNWGREDSIFGPNCPAVVGSAYSYILAHENIKTVVMSLFARDLKMWGIDGANDRDLNERFSIIKHLFDRDIDDLQKAGKKVIISFDMPLYPLDAHACFSRFTVKKCSVAEADLLDREPYLQLFNDYFEKKRNVCIVRVSKALIHNGVASMLDPSGTLLLRDDHHLSYRGSEFVAQQYYEQGCVALTE